MLFLKRSQDVIRPMLRTLYLRQLHLHVSKNVQEAHDCIPQSAVSQTLLVPNARALRVNLDQTKKRHQRSDCRKTDGAALIPISCLT